VEAAFMEDYEKLGVFYLGRPYSLADKKSQGGLFLYNSQDLLTHAVCVGMTGSGKTGLCISLLEEAAIDNIPAIAIDPKGDLTNLLLTFPDLQPVNFLPWINDEDARKKNLSLEEYAGQQAETWKNGLAAWGQSGDRIKRLRQSADFIIYTPGSTAGVPVSILKSFSAPPPAVIEDAELLRERINTTVTSLLGIIGIAADPVKSREHILISTLLSLAWKKGQDIGIAALIQQIQNPPISQIGVMDLNSFYPAKERFNLALALNNLLAAPGFDTWMAGEPLDINSLLYTTAGKPKISIFSIAHLNDAERMFFVSLLLNQLLGWMRTQSGTTSLRAILYMDEIFGYFPPVANPPSKTPLLTLLKQARAYGLGIVLSTQNPVDLDYKGLSNTGTWFIGRLQTERDKARVLEGLEGVAVSQGMKWSRSGIERTLAGLSNRVFLMNNVHDDLPLVFESRWCMSYLRGPLTRNQIKLLMDPLKQNKANPPSVNSQADSVNSQPDLTAKINTIGPVKPGNRPVLPPQVKQYYIPVRTPQPSSHILFYLPAIIAAATIHFADAEIGVNLNKSILYLAEVPADLKSIDWSTIAEINIQLNDLEPTTVEPAHYGELPQVALSPQSYIYWFNNINDWLYQNQRINLLKSPAMLEYSRFDESERDFRVRLQQKAREHRDAAMAKLREKYTLTFNSLQEQIRQAQVYANNETDTSRQSKSLTGFSFGSTLLGGFLGRKVLSSKSDISNDPSIIQENRYAEQAEDTVEAIQKKLQKLEKDFKTDTEALSRGIDYITEPLELISVRPAKTAIAVQLLALGWLPLWQSQTGKLTPAWE
jgi:hypothetical protein